MQPILYYVEPWQFSPTVLLACALPVTAYARGMMVARRAGEQIGFWRPAAFFIGFGLIYTALQTYVDFLAQHMFWMHCLQQMFLHHLGPFLITLAMPWDTVARGTPPLLRDRVVGPLLRSRMVQSVYGFVRDPLVAPVLFVGMIYFWLVPAIHFTAMLDVHRYRAMTWGMAVDGLLFWPLVITPLTSRTRHGLGYLRRIVMLFCVMVTQIILGAYITFHGSILYNVYGICGRAWSISPMTDQQIGGLLLWIPPSMMSAIAFLINVRFVMHDPGTPEAARSAVANAAGN